MIRLVSSLALALAVTGLVTAPVSSQPRPKLEKSVTKQREALDYWTTCLAAEERARVSAVLLIDYRKDEYKDGLSELAETRVSSECFDDIPRAYRKMRLGGLPFAGALAEKLIAAGEEPLVIRLSKAAFNTEVGTFSYTDKAANCTVRGAPHLAAALFETKFETLEEQQALAQLRPVIDYCTRDGAKIEANAMAMRSMLATASYRLLAAQDRTEEDDA